MQQIVERILESRQNKSPDRSLLVGISGIDAGGKGFVAAKLAERLNEKNISTAVINADGWLNLPPVRFGKTNPAEHFYHHAFRFDEMFAKLILPLSSDRSVKLSADLAEETALEFRRHQYQFRNIDVILLEGIFLFKKSYRAHFDLKIWIECSFATALQRAVKRAQENLPPEETARAYETIYFPAQRIHFEKDDPQGSADIVFQNDIF